MASIILYYLILDSYASKLVAVGVCVQLILRTGVTDRLTKIILGKLIIQWPGDERTKDPQQIIIRTVGLVKKAKVLKKRWLIYLRKGIRNDSSRR